MGLFSFADRALIISSVLLFSVPGHVIAQNGSADSAAIYEKLHAYSQKHKVTRWIYGAVFEEPGAKSISNPDDPLARRSDPYRKQKGKIIRRIDVHVRDPFGNTLNDTANTRIGKLARIGNGLHRATRPRIIRELLLVAPLDTVDPLELAESERLLRASPAVNDARIILRAVKGSRDSVDVLVYVLDKWTIDATGDVGTSGGSLTLTDRNFLGLGQQFEQGAEYTLGSDRPNFNGKHAVYNIADTYIGSSLFYSVSDAEDLLGAELRRAFYSPLTKWAGAAALTRAWTHVSVADANGTLVEQSPVHPVSMDTWLGRSFRLSDDTSRYGQSSHFIVAARYAQTRYAQRPSFLLDTLRANSNTSLFLVGVGLSLQQFYKERYLYRFGLTEDVPEGLLLRANVGVRKREGLNSEPYIGLEITRGRSYDAFGYLSATVAYGTFLQDGRTVDGALKVDLDYFTDLLKLGKWHLRQFVKLRSTIGLNKPAGQTLDLNGEQLYGFSSAEVSGTRKTLIGSQTVLYAPYSILGFRFAPIALIGLGTVDNTNDPWFGQRIYPAFALGLLVRNEYLLVKTFQLSIGFYPDVPGSESATTLFNPVSSFQLGARNYAYSQPEVVGYY